MARIIEDTIAGPDDEMYQEGPTIWSPNYIPPGMPSGSIRITPDGKVPEQRERKTSHHGFRKAHTGWLMKVTESHVVQVWQGAAM
jgi:hypothetical protein